MATRLALACAMVPVAFVAAAEPSLSVARLSCEQVQAELKAIGAAILRFQTSDRTKRNYDRYVSDSRFCDSGQTAVLASVPTGDRDSCPVRKCESVN